MPFSPKAGATISVLETMLYIGVAVVLIVAALTGLIQAAIVLWRDGLSGSSAPAVLDQLLLVLMLVEILHTVRISLHTRKLTMVPFLIVGLIASIRRVLVITMQAARLAEQESAERAIAFRNSMIELGVLAVLIVVFVVSIARLHPISPRDHEEPSAA